MENNKQERLLAGDIVQHFKGGLYVIINIDVKHTESGERLVVYHNSEGVYFARPYDMFMSKVDNEKYPDVEQEYRMEKVTAKKKCHK